MFLLFVGVAFIYLFYKLKWMSLFCFQHNNSKKDKWWKRYIWYLYKEEENFNIKAIAQVKQNVKDQNRNKQSVMIPLNASA